MEHNLQIAPCPWCTSTDVKVVVETISTFRKTNYGFALCGECGVKSAVPFSNKGLDYEAVQARHTGYALHIADNEWIHAILARGPEPHWAQAAIDFLAEKTMDSRYIHVVQSAIAAAQRNERLKILEVGCNLGYVGAVLHRLGHDYTGLDIQQEAVATARLYYGDRYLAEPIEKFAARTIEQFDLICSFDVIEHVSHPRQFIDACVSLLNPNGRLVLTTPNGDQMRDDEWLTDLPPIHLTVFRRSAFEKVYPYLTINIVDDLQHNRPGPHIWNRIRHRLRSKIRYEKVPVIDPENPVFAYGVIDQPLRIPNVLRRRDIFRRAVADLASVTLGSPVGYCMIVEIMRSGQKTRFSST